MAALVNGTAGHALDLTNIGLGAGNIQRRDPAGGLAVAEQTQADGATFTDALVVAYEVPTGSPPCTRHTPRPYASGLSQAVRVFEPRRCSWMLAATWTLPGRHRMRPRHSCIAGRRAARQFWDMTKPLHAGMAKPHRGRGVPVGPLRLHCKHRDSRAAFRLARRDLPRRGRPGCRAGQALYRWLVNAVCGRGRMTFKAYPCAGAKSLRHRRSAQCAPRFRIDRVSRGDARRLD